MELKHFIESTLVQIMEGVHSAITKHSNLNISGAINPVWGTVNDIKDNHKQTVEFDIAVTITEKTDKTGKGGVKVLSVVDFGGEGKKSNEKNSENRVKFSIPIIPPVVTVKQTT